MERLIFPDFSAGLLLELACRAAAICLLKQLA
jgi:hypothetical protein